MKIAVISDTHNNLVNLERALDLIRSEGINTIIHCGDLTDVKVALALTSFRLIVTLGNGDLEFQQIAGTVHQALPGSFCGLVYRGTLEGVPLAATHGHLPGKVDELVRSAEHHYLFHGHSHRRRDELIGNTRILNPGSLGGLRAQERSFLILDLESSLAEFKLLV